MREKYQILIVDDSLDDIEMCKRALSTCQQVLYEFSHETSGKAVLNSLNTLLPDCILLDYSLPGSDGLTILQQIRALYQHIPVVILTGQGSEVLAAQLIRAGAQDYIIKSCINPLTLHNVISQAITQNLGKANDTLVNILIVDDNPDDREKVVRSLKKCTYPNYHCREARNGDTMFDNIKAEGLPDCILLDYSLPGSSGLALLGKLLSEHPLLPIIMMTGQGNEQIAVKAIKNGAQNYIVKGELTQSNLLKSISTALASTKMEKRLAEKEMALREANSFNMTIMESASHLIIATDQLGIVSFFNKAAQETLKYTANEIVGRYTPTLWHDEHEIINRANELSNEMDRAINPDFDVFVVIPNLHGSEKREWLIYDKNGEAIPANVTVTCMRDIQGNTTGYLSVIEDIREKRQTERSLDEYRSFLELIMNNNPDYIFVKDKNFRITQANQAFLSIYPLELRQDIIGNTTFENYEQNSVDDILLKDEEAFKQGYSESQETIRFPDGKIRTLFTQKIRFENTSKEPFILCIGRDVTEREHLIKHLKETNEDLEKFAYVASHDLKSPLRAIDNLSKWLKEDAWSMLDTKNQERIELMIGRVARMESLLDDLLDYSRAGRVNNDSEMSDAKHLVEDITRNLLHKPDKIKIIVTDDLKGISIPIMPLEQIFQNLINNAIKHHDKDEGTITISVTVLVDYYQFSVADDGPGIPERFQEKIFEMFQTLKPRDEVEGSGMGLALVRKLVNRHGGKVDVNSQEGQGANFLFTWPKRDSDTSTLIRMCSNDRKDRTSITR